MKSVEFCYWLQGMFELNAPQTLDVHQTDLIKRHLALVFKHEIDPSYPNQHLLTEMHSGKPNAPSGIDFGKLQLGGQDSGGNTYRC